MDQKSLKPRIRFKGFTEAWEQRELGQEGTTFTGLSGKTKDDFGHGSGAFVTYMNVFKNPIADPTMVEPIDIDNSQKEIRYGDIFFTTSSETPDEVGMSSIWVKKATNIYLNSFCFGYRLNNLSKYDLSFLAYNFRAESFRKDMVLLAQGISRYNISKNKVMEIQTAVPRCLEEQAKIGKFLVELDNLITLHQRKYFIIFNIQKAKLGNNCHSLEQRKLGDYGVCKSGVGFPDKEQGGTSGTPFYKVSDMNIEGNERELISSNNYVSKEQITSNSWNVLKAPSVFFAKVGAAVILNRKRLVLNDFLLDNNTMAYVIDSTKWDTNFCFNTFEKTDLTTLVQVGALPSYNANQVEDIEITIPNKKEQKKIGLFFSNLDNLITLHQREQIQLLEDY
ncbi:MAG: restriction endonuclease subunit S [Bacillales bacterium]|nr:restriction endonuclease subunit S [Bacillales bacterium]